MLCGTHTWEQRTCLLLITSKGTIDPFGSEPWRKQNSLENPPKHCCSWGGREQDRGSSGILLRGWEQPGPCHCPGMGKGMDTNPGAALPFGSSSPEVPLDVSSSPVDLRVPPLLNSPEVPGLGCNSLVKESTPCLSPLLPYLPFHEAESGG